jgi:HNH endonuclease/AP2 domain
MITQDRLKYWLYYNEIAGEFNWLVSPRNGIKDYDVAGTFQNGYIRIRVDGKKYLAHRLAFLYMTGEWPKDQVDHINGIRDDNRWCNLRNCTNSENKMNTRLQANNKSGYKGVHWDNIQKKWRASCRVNTKLVNIGRFDNIEDAYKSYQEFAKKSVWDILSRLIS